MAFEVCRDRPVFFRREGQDLTFAFHDQPKRDCLHPAGGDSLFHRPPEDGTRLVAHEAIENATRLLRFDLS